MQVNLKTSNTFKKDVPTKMQDIFGISNDENKKEKKQKEDNRNTDNGFFDPKSSLYKSIYESTISFEKEEPKEEEQKDEKPKVTIQRKNNILNYKNSKSIPILDFQKL